VDEETLSEDTDVCVAMWVDTAKDKPLACSFLRPSHGKREEVKFTFDVSKCDKLFDVLLQNKVIRFSEGHVILPSGQNLVQHCLSWFGHIQRRPAEAPIHNG
jgi:hypothetical protein